MNIEELKLLATKFNSSIELIIEKTKTYDLAVIEARGHNRFTDEEIRIFRHNLDGIARYQHRIKLIEEFVEFCEDHQEKRDEE